MVKKYFYEKLWIPLKGFLQQGLTPKKLALTLALGAILGLFPVVGTTTILCFVFAIIFRLNIAVIQLVNYFVYPIQLIIFIPLIRFGSYIFKLGPIPDLEYFVSNKWEAIKLFSMSVISGIAVWAILAIPVFLMIYFLAEKALSRVKVSEH